eukprot:1716020-Pleurochrysis_carterae.AAC.2
MIGGARKPSTKQPTTRQYSYYGECIASDLMCEMPTSTPFGFRYMLCFYDLATKYLETFLADNLRYLSGRVTTWLAVNGSEFFDKNIDALFRE